MTVSVIPPVGRRKFLHPGAETSRSNGIESFLDRHTDAYWYYGSGKVALRDALRTMRLTDESGPRGARRGPERRRRNVLLPAYVPDAVAEPMYELGLEPRYYAVTPELEPDVADLERRTDDGTLAVVSIDYFGFPQPGLSAVVRHVEEWDCYHIDDNAHATLSVADGRLLGTIGDVGISSLWKTLPIPNGAVLYVTDDRLKGRFEPSSFAGVDDRVGVDDVQFLCASVVHDVLDTAPMLRRPVDAIVDRIYGSDVTDPKTRYEVSKRQFSGLSARICARIDPEVLRTRRRQRYRAWIDAIAPIPDVRPLFPALPDGICPQSAPVVTDHPRRVQSYLARSGFDGVHTWPRLPAEVKRDPTYETAQNLAHRVLALPVDRNVDLERIASAGSVLSDDFRPAR